ncbi:MAG: hypothetical protein P0Y49_04530 [Candidatus Pedobacter colombiensis]|uniref:Uncharacterized protein n=1 Tax=Candidatus Pedobacter colombiensis TaxID=3121371 RepID=A0AAJ6B9P2_9SPHI|nr:hypothetical protein [Pedobacter sp.]WEK20403.1 MAG: hypothetical protein P0Y49_04530 [Pedobacter sp.]
MQRTGYTHDGYLWQLEYRDTLKLLEEKIILFLRLNEKLRNNIQNKSRFVSNKVEFVEFNLLEFAEGYRAKFIDPDMEKYCLRFMELLKPVLTGFVKEIGYSANSFRFRFRYGGRVFEKGMGITIPKESGEE